MASLSSHTWLARAGRVSVVPKTTNSLPEVLAGNVRKLMAANKKEVGSQPKLAAKAGVGQRTVGRATKGEVSTTIGSVAAIARALGVEPWELLNPDAGAQTLKPDEREMLELYRAASPRWQMSLRYMAALKGDVQDDMAESVNVLYARISAKHASDERVAKKLGTVEDYMKKEAAKAEATKETKAK